MILSNLIFRESKLICLFLFFSLVLPPVRLLFPSEKPELLDAPSNLAIIGRYILTSEIFDVLERTQPDKNGEIQITDALLVQAKEGNVVALKFKGERFDCGSIDGFVDATNHFAKKLNI